MKRFISLALLMSLAVLQGCASYSHNLQSEPTQWPLSNEKPTKAYLSVHAEYQLNDAAANSITNITALENLVKKDLEESGYFSAVTTQKEAADVYATVTLRNHEEGSMGLAFITGLSLFLIPGAFDNTYSVEMRFRDADGNVIGKTSAQERVTTWMHLILLPAAPFARADIDETISILTKRALEKAIQEKII